MRPKIITAQEKRVILKNFASLSTLQSINYLLPFIILPYLIRVLEPEKFGLIAFAQAFVQYFMILTDYGFSLSATRKISLCGEDRKKTSAIFSSVMTVKIILAACSLLILIAVIKLVPRFRNDWMVYALSFPAVAGNALFPSWFFQGKEKMAYITRINATGGILYALCLLIFVRYPQDYLYVPLLNSLFFLITGILGLFVACRKFKLEFIFQSLNEIKRELKSGWNVFVSIVSINAYTATRIFAVGLLTNNTLTGFYSIAEKIANFIQTFPLDSLSQAIYPRLNKIFVKNKARAVKFMRKVQWSTTFGYLITAPIVFVIAPLIVSIICGKIYPEVVITLRVLLLGVFFVGANAFSVQFLLISGRADIYSKLHVIAALIGLPLIFLLIYRFSYLGAAISTVIIEAGVIIATSIILRRFWPIR